MPRVKKNTLIKGLSGNFQKEFVYKVRGDGTFVAGMPVIDKTRVRTPTQIRFRQRGASARAYARAAMANPELKAFYESRRSSANSAYNVAFRDFQTSPEVYDIDTSKYTGVTGSQISVSAFDKGKVTGVTVRIFSAAGVLLEEGETVYSDIKGDKWFYTTTQNNISIPGTKVTVIARNLPENETIVDKIL
jgi:hypothetical protein